MHANLNSLTPIKSTKASHYTGPVIPLKHRPGCPSARELFNQIMAGQDFGPIKRELVREMNASDTKEAEQLIEAFVQWYATGSVTKTKSFVMFTGKVDKVFHTMILNSPWYMRFCYTTTRVYTNHEPITEMNMSPEDIMDAAVYTASLLETTWGDELSPYLRDYVKAVKTGDYAAATVSCPSNESLFDIVLR